MKISWTPKKYFWTWYLASKFYVKVKFKTQIRYTNITKRLKKKNYVYLKYLINDIEKSNEMNEEKVKVKFQYYRVK